MHDARTSLSGEEPPRIVVLSGPVGSGKSTLGRNLANKFNLEHVRTQDLMREVASANKTELAAERKAMQQYGERLDAETGGQWVADEIGRMLA